MLRHSFALHVLQSSGDLRAGDAHTSIASTQVHTHLDFQHLAAVDDQFYAMCQTSRIDPHDG